MFKQVKNETEKNEERTSISNDQLREKKKNF